HHRLYEFLRNTTIDKKADPTLEDLQPLCQAVVHGCEADIGQKAFYEIYWSRLQRKRRHYLVKELGACGTDLECISAFFSNPWQEVRRNLDTEVAIQVLESASEGLHALGRLSEALQAAESLASAVPANRQHDITNAVILLSEISISLGRI